MKTKITMMSAVFLLLSVGLAGAQGVTTGVTTFDLGTDTASGSSATMSNIYGALIYDSTVSNYGICYLYFGGVNAVTSATLTVVYNSSGVFYVTV